MENKECCSCCGKNPAAKLFYLGHSSFRLTAKDGTVIYIDPFAPGDYKAPADIILLTHQHPDHCQIGLVTQNKDCVTITNVEALEGGKHNSFTVKGIQIEAVEAGNQNHSSQECVGYIINIDGVKLYHPGDTSKTAQMETFAEKKLDYALIPCDGFYNMDAKGAAECAALMGAKHNIPIHTGPFMEGMPKMFDRSIAESCQYPNMLIIEPGNEIELA